MAFSPDGKVLLTTRSGPDGAALGRDHRFALGPPFRYPARSSKQLAFSPDGKTLLSGATTDTCGLDLRWSHGHVRGRTARTARHVIRGGVQSRRQDLSHRAGQRRSCSCGMWRHSHRSASPSRIPVPSVEWRFSPDGKIRPHRLRGRQRAGSGTSQPGNHCSHPSSIKAASVAVAFSPDGKTVAHWRQDKTVAALGRRHRPAHRPHPAASDTCLIVAFSRRRQDLPHRERDGLRLFPFLRTCPMTWTRRHLGRGPHRAAARQATGPDPGPRQRGLARAPRTTDATGRSARDRARTEARPDPLRSRPHRPRAGLIERKQWDAAEAAFDEAMRARPFNMSIVWSGVICTPIVVSGARPPPTLQERSSSIPTSRRSTTTGRHSAPGGRPARLPSSVCRDAGSVQADRRFHRRRSRGLRVQPRRRCGPRSARLDPRFAERSTRWVAS